WIKSVVHPRLTDIGDDDLSDPGDIEGFDIEEASFAGRDCWRLKISGLKEDEPTIFTVDVDQVTGSFLRQQHPDVDAEMWVDEVVVDTPLADGIFDWTPR
ncbi:MAG: hypothetical protein LC808_30215, partial [Actinobacteria bacterium]|nr:hypothetical protein [Actinomycetota bacterium]